MTDPEIIQLIVFLIINALSFYFGYRNACQIKNSEIRKLEEKLQDERKHQRL